jgi:hypothetical protein
MGREGGMERWEERW